MVNLEKCLKIIGELDSDKKFQIYSTHDIVVCVMAFAICHYNMMKMDLEIPVYCSNVRIEEWERDQDTYIRIYYDNTYIGCDI